MGDDDEPTDSLGRFVGGCGCGEPWDRDCMGNRRCPVCDPPCPCCYDGGGPDDDENAIDDVLFAADD